MEKPVKKPKAFDVNQGKISFAYNLIHTKEEKDFKIYIESLNPMSEEFRYFLYLNNQGELFQKNDGKESLISIIDFKKKFINMLQQNTEKFNQLPLATFLKTKDLINYLNLYLKDPLDQLSWKIACSDIQNKFDKVMPVQAAELSKKECESKMKSLDTGRNSIFKSNRILENHNREIEQLWVLIHSCKITYDDFAKHHKEILTPNIIYQFLKQLQYNFRQNDDPSLLFWFLDNFLCTKNAFSFDNFMGIYFYRENNYTFINGPENDIFQAKFENIFNRCVKKNIFDSNLLLTYDPSGEGDNLTISSGNNNFKLSPSNYLALYEKYPFIRSNIHSNIITIFKNPNFFTAVTKSPFFDPKISDELGNNFLMGLACIGNLELIKEVVDKDNTLLTQLSHKNNSALTHSLLGISDFYTTLGKEEHEGKTYDKKTVEYLLNNTPSEILKNDCSLQAAIRYN